MIKNWPMKLAMPIRIIITWTAIMGEVRSPELCLNNMKIMQGRAKMYAAPHIAPANLQQRYQEHQRRVSSWRGMHYPERALLMTVS